MKRFYILKIALACLSGCLSLTANAQQSQWSGLLMNTGYNDPMMTVNSIRFFYGKTYICADPGLSIYNGSAWITFNTNVFTNYGIYDVAVEANGNMWVATSTGVYLKTPAGSWQNLQCPGLPIVTKVIIDQNNAKWFVARTNNNTYHWGVAKYFNSAWTVYDSSNSSITNAAIPDIKSAPGNTIWVLNGNNVRKFNGTNWTTYNWQSWGSVQAFPVTAMDVDNSGNLWIVSSHYYPSYGIESLALERFDGASWTEFGSGEYLSYPVNSLKSDALGNKWLFNGSEFYKFDGLVFSNLGSPNTYGGPMNMNTDGIAWFCDAWWWNSPGVYQVLLYKESGFNAIKGRVFNDLNGDGIRQANEPNITNRMVSLQPQNMSMITDAQGYAFGLIDTSGTYSVSIASFPCWQPTTPNPLNVIQTYNGQVSDSVDIGIKVASFTNDLSLSLTTGSCSLSHNNAGWISLSNLGTTILDDSVKLWLDPAVSFVNANPPPDQQNGNLITWHFSNFSPFDTRTIFFSFHVGSTTAPGSILATYATVFPIAGDTTPLNNTDTVKNEVTGSYDPNAKEVSPKGEGVDGAVLPGTELTYTIHFQNTGTDTAYNIIIKDTLSPFADLSSFQVIGYSHPVQFALNGQLLTFSFNNIMLADSGANQAASNGFVKYSLRPLAGLAGGTKIKNRAWIFFDYNVPVPTNKVTNMIDYAASVARIDAPDISLWPNPATSILRLSLASLGTSGQLIMYDITGKKLMEMKLNNSLKQDINVSNLAKGVYILKVSTNEKCLVKKFIKD